jgi:hypothetical protein
MQPRYDPTPLSECNKFAQLHPTCDDIVLQSECMTHDHAGVPDHEQGGA